MSTLKINWGTRIALLYGGFVALIVVLVTGSMRQDFDLVSKDYYQKELEYQQIIDAGKNQASLSAPVSVHANERYVFIEFPVEFKESALTGTVLFYSEVNAAWDKSFPVEASINKVQIPRSALERTNYIVKINWKADNKDYFQQSAINLSK